MVERCNPSFILALLLETWCIAVDDDNNDDDVAAILGCGEDNCGLGVFHGKSGTTVADVTISNASVNKDDCNELLIMFWTSNVDVL